MLYTILIPMTGEDVLWKYVCFTVISDQWTDVEKINENSKIYKKYVLYKWSWFKEKPVRWKLRLKKIDYRYKKYKIKHALYALHALHMYKVILKQINICIKYQCIYF